MAQKADEPVSLNHFLQDVGRATEDAALTTRADIRAIIGAIDAASVEIADFVALGRIAPEEGGDRPIEVEADTAPAARARRIIANRLAGKGVRDIVWRDSAQLLDPDGVYSVAIDPLDGSSNLDANMTLGTIFSIAYAGDAASPRDGQNQLAAGFIVYGPQTNFVLTLGDGVNVFTLDRRDGTYRLAQRGIEVPGATREYAIDSSNCRHWPPAVRTLIDDYREEASAPGAATFNMRWIGSLVAETYRILMRGGVFLCPGDTRGGKETGCQRLLSAAHPIAFVIEQAGGRATTGHGRILERTTTRLDARTSFIFGSRENVERIERLHGLPESLSERSPLFRPRGLFQV